MGEHETICKIMDFSGSALKGRGEENELIGLTNLIMRWTIY